MNIAIKQARKLFNYTFKNEYGHVKTANLLDAYTHIRQKFKSDYFNLTVWTRIVKSFLVSFMKKKIMDIIKHDTETYFNKMKILREYRPAYIDLIENIDYILTTRNLGIYNETNFYTCRFMVEHWNFFLKYVRDSRDNHFEFTPIETRETQTPQPYEELIPVETRETQTPQPYEELIPVEEHKVPKKYTKPYQQFHKILTYSKGRRGLHYALEFD